MTLKGRIPLPSFLSSRSLLPLTLLSCLSVLCVYLAVSGGRWFCQQLLICGLPEK